MKLKYFKHKDSFDPSHSLFPRSVGIFNLLRRKLANGPRWVTDRFASVGVPSQGLVCVEFEQRRQHQRQQRKQQRHVVQEKQLSVQKVQYLQSRRL